LLSCCDELSTQNWSGQGLSNDANPMFLRQFYKCMKIVCQDMFFSRSRSSTTSRGLLSVAPPMSGRRALEAAFKVTKSVEERSNVTGELVDMKVSDPVTEKFSEQAVSDRVSGYEKYAGQAQIRQMLMSQGGVSSQGDIVAQRLAELKGQSTTPDKALKIGRPAVRIDAITSQRQLLESQLKNLQSKGDSLNMELTNVMKEESGMKESIKAAGDNVETTEIKNKLTSMMMRKDNLLRRINHLEADIDAKGKDLAKAK
jgi:chromosome segregation ATPase